MGLIFEEVAPNLYRGQRPNTFQEMQDRNVDYVFNLQSGFFEIFTNTVYERQLSSDFKVTELNFPMSDWEIPDFVQVGKIIELIEHHRKTGRKVFVHCKWGKDRTGYVIAAWKMRYLGMKYEDAVKDMYSHGYHRFPYFYWVKSLKKFENTLDAPRIDLEPKINLEYRK